MADSREWSFEGSRGRLFARRWSGGDEPLFITVIAHGYGEHIGRYERLAEALVESGAAVYAVDHQGHGRSDGERVHVSDFEDVVSDLHLLDATARREHPGLPVVLLGHSMGGLIASRYAQRYGETLAALVLSSPVIGRWDIVQEILALEEIPDTPLDPTTLSRDPAVWEAYATDPLIWHGPFKRTTLEALQAALDAINASPSVNRLPVLWIHGDADALVPIDASREGIYHLRGERFVEQIYAGDRHELFNELNAAEVTADVVAFIQSQLAVQ